MKYKTLFRLVMKALGVVFIGLALPGLVGGIGQLAMYVASNPGFPGGWPPPGWWWQVALSSLGHVVQLALGLYLLLGGTWIVDKAIPSNRPYCPECGYDLSTRTGDHCPECGTNVPGEVRGG
ncbi:MAG: hypothetical protein ACYSTY_04535 [Planctomycetota bacterium]|jgi:hypothetical protein